MTFGYERNDLMNTVGLSGEDRLELGALILQASELIKIFIGKFNGFLKSMMGCRTQKVFVPIWNILY
jgi:hypothetical protein